MGNESNNQQQSAIGFTRDKTTGQLIVTVFRPQGGAPHLVITGAELVGGVSDPGGDREVEWEGTYESAEGQRGECWVVHNNQVYRIPC